MGGEPKVSEDGTPVVEGSSTMGTVFSLASDIPLRALLVPVYRYTVVPVTQTLEGPLSLVQIRKFTMIHRKFIHFVNLPNIQHFGNCIEGYSLTFFFVDNFESETVQKHANLVDLAKC